MTLPPNIILVASVYRSGGTWLFNAARMLVEAAGHEVHAAWITEHEPGAPARFHVVKAHKPDQIGFTPWKILTSRRDLASRLASNIRMGWLADKPENIVTAATNYIALEAYWRERTNLEVAFSDIVERPAKALGEIAGALDLDTSRAQHEEIADALSRLKAPGDGGPDPVTLLHPGHRAGAGDTERIAACVRTVLKNAGLAAS